MTTKGEKPYYRLVGKPRQGHVLLVHGFAMEHRLWLPSIAPLLNQFQFILPDLRGFGRSSHLEIPKECVVNINADDIEQAVNELGIEKLYLGGFSLGGLISMELLKRWGSDRVIKFLNIDQSAKPVSDDSWPYGLGGMRGSEFLSMAEGILSEVGKYPDEIDFSKLPEEVRGIVYEGFGLFLANAVSGVVPKKVSPLIFKIPRVRDRLSIFRSWQSTISVIRSYVNENYDYRELLNKIDLPVTYMVGGKSDIYPKKGQVITHESTPESTLVTFQKSGHDLLLKEPIKFSRELKKFLSEAA